MITVCYHTTGILTRMTTALTTAYADAEAYARQALSPATLRAYKSDWADFLSWCRAAGANPVPAAPETVAAYLASMATTHARATIERRLVSITQAHKLAGLDFRSSHPTVRNTLRGLFRRHGRPQRKAAALGLRQISAILAVCSGSFVARRDRAMLLIGFAGALRRSEIARIRVEDLAFTDEGLRLTLPRSKTDAAGEGAEVGIPTGSNPETCPVAALRGWLDAAGFTAGPVFRKIRADGSIMEASLHPTSVGRILQKRAAEAGLTINPGERLSAHGLRAGFITETYRAGARDEDIMRHTRHRDLKTMRGYVRRAKLLTDSPAKLLGL